MSQGLDTAKCHCPLCAGCVVTNQRCCILLCSWAVANPLLITKGFAVTSVGTGEQK